MKVDDLVSRYVSAAMVYAEYEQLDRDGVIGRIPACIGVLGFGSAPERCETDLRGALEEWVWLCLKWDVPIPVIDNIDLGTAEVAHAIQADGFWERFDPKFGELVGE